MHRIDTSTRQVDKFGTGKDGFTDGSPGVTPPTALTATFFDSVQEEIANVVEGNGGTLSGANNHQLDDALRSLTGNGYHDLTTTTAGHPAVKGTGSATDPGVVGVGTATEPGLSASPGSQATLQRAAGHLDAQRDPLDHMALGDIALLTPNVASPSGGKLCIAQGAAAIDRYVSQSYSSQGQTVTSASPTLALATIGPNSLRTGSHIEVMVGGRVTDNGSGASSSWRVDLQVTDGTTVIGSGGSLGIWEMPFGAPALQSIQFHLDLVVGGDPTVATAIGCMGHGLVDSAPGNFLYTANPITLNTNTTLGIQLVMTPAGGTGTIFVADVVVLRWT